MKIKHYDLFAGIGGFSLALEEIFNGTRIEHVFCEWEKFPTAVLRKHWPRGEFWGDIADLVAHTERERLESGREQASGQYDFNHKTRQSEELTIVTGGFPCQPFSAAGRRRGTADDRYRWPQMFEVIRNVAPQWVIAENVGGFVTWNEGLVLETVCLDLESAGYEVQAFIIPAVATGAPHRRDRVWIIGHAKNDTGFARMGLERESQSETAELSSQDPDASNSGRERRKQGLDESIRSERTESGRTKYEYPDWGRDWQEVAVATCNAGMDDGLSRRVDGIPYSFSKWRKESLKAYGNAIVPQVAMQIFKAIKEEMYVRN